jgi:hypothetical protein
MDDSNSCGSVRHVDEACSHRRRRGIRAVRTASFHVPNCARLCNSPKVKPVCRRINRLRPKRCPVPFCAHGRLFRICSVPGSPLPRFPAFLPYNSAFPIPHSAFSASPLLRFSDSPFLPFSVSPFLRLSLPPSRLVSRLSALGSVWSFRIPHSARLPACSPASLKREASALPPKKPPGPLKTLKQLIRSERKNESVPLLCYSKNHAETASPRNQPLSAGPRHAPHNVPHDRVYVHGH